MKKLLGPDKGWEVSSAGVCAADGLPVSHNAVAVLQEKGIDISDHRARHLSPEMIEEADLLIAMTQGHRNAIRTIAPETDGKVFLLKSFGVAQCAADIADPVGADLAVYRRARDEIDAALPDLVLFLMEERNDT